MKRRMAALFMTSLLALSMTACGDTPVETSPGMEDGDEEQDLQEEKDMPESADAEEITITFWNAWVGSDGETLTELVDQFNEENPYGITVDMTITSSVTEMLQSGLPTGDAADLFLVYIGCIHKYDWYLQSIYSIFDDIDLKKGAFLESY